MGTTETRFSTTEARRRLYDVMGRGGSVAERAEAALKLATRCLDVENGHLTRIDPAANYWETIESTAPPDGDLPVGLSLDLGTTYCRRVLENESQVVLHDADAQGLADDPAVQAHGLQCYLGTPVRVDGTVYGTVCFVGEDARDEDFSDEEMAFAELVAQLVGDAIERERVERELTERTEMVGVLDRVLRHNLRNDLNVVRGHAESMATVEDVHVTNHADVIVRTVDDLLALSEHARHLNSLVSETVDRRSLDVEALLGRVVEQVAADNPEATISLEGAAGAGLLGSPQLEAAFAELVANAATHAGAEPVVEVTVEQGESALQVTVADDGPGISPHDVAVFRHGAESPLQHGSGLGLWLVYWVVVRHGGTTKASVRDGTSVTVTLPYGPRNYLEPREATAE